MNTTLNPENGYHAYRNSSTRLKRISLTRIGIENVSLLTTVSICVPPCPDFFQSGSQKARHRLKIISRIPHRTLGEFVGFMEFIGFIGFIEFVWLTP